MARAGSGGASQALTRLTLEVYGDVCWLCGRPGATSKDHVIPYSLGGTDDLENMRPAHLRCNKRRGNRVISGYGVTINVVIGPPAAGKTTFVLERASITDVVVDLDAIARALMPAQLDGRTHVYPEHVRHVAIGARAAAIERATRLTVGCAVWIIHADPSPKDLEQYQFLRYTIHTIDPGRAVVEQRVRAERPPYMRAYVPKWYAKHGNRPAPQSPVPATAGTANQETEEDW